MMGFDGALVLCTFQRGKQKDSLLRWVTKKARLDINTFTRIRPPIGSNIRIHYYPCIMMFNMIIFSVHIVFTSCSSSIYLFIISLPELIKKISFRMILESDF